MSERTLSHGEARRFYDRFGARQDRQGWYEDAALDRLTELGELDQAHRVLELGSGTGKFAARLLERELAPGANYLALDLSTTMVELTTERLAPFGTRARVERVDGSLPIHVDGELVPQCGFDRFVSTYVLDLLADSEIDAVLAEAWRVLEPGGLLCLASLAPGRTRVSFWVSRLWTAIHRLRPALLGGCRPVEVAPRIGPPQWGAPHHECVIARGLASEVLVARRP